MDDDGIDMRPLLFSDDLQFWFETLRALGHTAYGGADIGEVITTAQRIRSGDYDSWYDEWAATARRTEAEARSQLSVGHQVSGRDGLLRAATYYRSAEFFTRDRDPDPRGRPTYEASVRCFDDAIALMSPAVMPVTIPFEGTTLNGYLYQQSRGGPQATCICTVALTARPRNGTTWERWPLRRAATPSSPLTGRASRGPCTATGCGSGPTGRRW
jgi:hypothetical protein